MKYVSVGLVILLLFSGCSLFGDSYRYELEDQSLSHNPALLIGEWDWTHSNIYGITGGQGRETPESTGRTERLVFFPDGTAEKYVNGELQQQGDYEILSSGTSIRLFGGGSSWQFGVSSRKLVLSSAAVDGPEMVYRRVGS